MEWDKMYSSGKSQVHPVEAGNKPVTVHNANPGNEINIYSQRQNGLDELAQRLGYCISILDDELGKNYLTTLEQLSPVTEDASSVSDLYFFQIDELVCEKDEFSPEKMTTVLHTLSGHQCTLAMMIHSDGKKNHFYLGVRQNDKSRDSNTACELLERTLCGQFPGTKTSRVYKEDVNSFLNSDSVNCISAVSCSADVRKKRDNADNASFVQSIDKMVNSMAGKEYTCIVLAQSVSYNELLQTRRNYESIFSQLSPFANIQMNYSYNDNQSVSKGATVGSSYNVSNGTNETNGTNFTVSKGTQDGTNTSINHGTTHGTNTSQSDGTSFSKNKSKSVTDGTTDSEFSSKTNSVSHGSSLGASFFAQVGVNSSISHATTKGRSHSTSHSVSHTNGITDTVSKTLTTGVSNSTSDGITHGVNHADTYNESFGNNHQTGVTHDENYGVNASDTETFSQAFGTSNGVTLNSQNKMIDSILKKLDLQISRIDECESIGMWDCAAYFLGESIDITESVANSWQSLVAGEQTGLQRSSINTWNKDENSDKFELVKNTVLKFNHPSFQYRSENDLVSPAVLVSTRELSLQMSLPKKSVAGLPVFEHATFGQEVVKEIYCKGSNELHLGKVFHLNHETPVDVFLDTQSLASHTFITGSTGSGKSNTVYNLMSKLKRKGIKVLVVEPAKGEYRTVFPEIPCYDTDPRGGSLLRINPFSFPSEVHILEHLDRLVEIFNVCWPMYAAMPAVLKESIERAYRACGWDLETSENNCIPNLFPSFDDVLRELDSTIRSSAYSADTKGDYIGSLSTRIKSLTNGINGLVFSNDEIDAHILFDENAIIDISKVGSMDTKSLIMGLVVMKLQEHRISQRIKGELSNNAKLHHITVLEEAHHLLKKTSTEQSAESSNLAGKSVEMLTNTIAEVRTYGEGFIIVDQAPDLLDKAVLRNTNTKIVMRLPETLDREVTGGAMALDDSQFAEISKLPTGVAAVYQNGWLETVLCKIPYSNTSVEHITRELRGEKPSHLTKNKCSINSLLHQLLQASKDQIYTDELIEDILKANASAAIRRNLILNINKNNLLYQYAVADFIKKNYVVSGLYRGISPDCSSSDEISRQMFENISQTFNEFNNDEIRAILRCVCLTESERFPQYKHDFEKIRLAI